MNSLNVTTQVTTVRRILSLALMLMVSLYGLGQARAQADVSVTAVTITAGKPSRNTVTGDLGTPTTKPTAKIVQAPENLKCSITVFSHNDDDANQTMLVVVVPVEVSIISNPSNATVYRAGGTSPFAGYLVFSLGDMAVGQSKTVEFTFTKSVYGNKVGAYAYSASPDPNPANNYKDATY